MFGLGSLATAFGIVKVVEQNGRIKITGVPGDYLTNVIAGTYIKGNKVSQNIFISITKTSLEFDSFFAVEVYLIFKRLEAEAAQYRAQRISRKIIKELEENSWVKDMIQPHVKPMIDLTLLKQFKYIPAPHQLKFLKEYGENVPRYQLRGYLLASPPGTGKALRVDTPVRVPDGWKLMGDIQPGDTVISRDGSHTTVTGVYPQGVTPTYRFTLYDGRYVDTCAEHQWKVIYNTTGESEVLTTIQIMELLAQNRGISIPLCVPEDTEETSRNWKRIQELVTQHGKIGVLDSLRIEDVDSEVADEVCKLMYALGGTITKFTDPAGRSDVYLHHAEPEKLCVGLGPDPRIDDLDIVTTVGIESVDPSGESLTQCIFVDHPEQLYVVKDHIVTHNTFMDLLLAAVVIPRSIAEIKIIISPKNAIDLVWAQDMGKYFKNPPGVWSSSTKGPAPETGFEYYVFHYEALDRALALGAALKKQGKKYFVIIDESHNFNTPTSQRSKNLVQLCTMNNAYSVWASGSPIKAMGTEIITMLRAIDPKFTPMVEERFKKAFGGDNAYANELLNNRIGKISFKIPKTDVIKDKAIPIKVRVKVKNPTPYLVETVRSEMKDYIEKRLKELQGDMDKYNAMFDSCLNFYKAKIRTKPQQTGFDEYVNAVELLRTGRVSGFAAAPYLSLTKNYEKQTLLPALPLPMQREFKQSRSIVKSLLLKVRGEALGRILSKRRAECSAELSKSCNLPKIVNEGLGKTLVYSTYTDALRAGDKYMQSQGYNTTYVYGDTAKDVTQRVRDFTDNDELNPLFASYPALSTAVPVIIANQIVMLDLPPRQYIFEQTVSRALRLGQKHPVYVFEILLDTGDTPNISTRGDEIITWSREQVTALMGEDFGGPKEDEYEIERIDAASVVESLNRR